MLALRSAKNEIENEMENNYSSIEDHQDIMDFAAGINLLDSIDFDDLFVGINDGDFLPDLEMDPREILADFSEESMSQSDVNMTSMVIMFEDDNNPNDNNNNNSSSSSSVIIEVGKTGSGSISDLGSGSTSPHGSEEEAVSKKDFNPSPKEGEKGRKSTKNPHGKRKVKVDWTPELHRRFVQAVEQLGVDKAVPSRILELMGIDCLTRHNIASHLQKYRSHRKHLLAREAEAASWSQRRQVYGGGGGAPVKSRPPHHWIAPTTMGFPHFRPLHVWGHPSVDQTIMPMWPPPPAHHPPSDHPPYWVPHPHHHHVPTPGTPCFPPHTRFPTPPVHGIPPPGMYKVEHAGVGVAPRQTLPQPPADVHPSKESVDAAIGDVLTKPWLPLPLGLKPPSMDSVMVELQRQGIPKIPPTCA